MSKPLQGVKVVEIAQEVAGPFAGLLLSDLGAEVVKIENRTGGDTSRGLVDIAIGGAEAKNPMLAPMFIGMNRGKRSVSCDLKKPEGAGIVRRMVGSYDVLLTNYRPGVLERLGLGFDELCKINPRIIYAQGSSWGPAGPWTTRPARDPLAQAAGGLMAKTGMPGDPPLVAGSFVADNSGALALAAGIMAGLFARERTGEAQRVDSSIYGTMIAMQATEINYTSFSGLESGPAGRGAHPFLFGVWGAFPTRDGHICLGGVDDKRWTAFCRVMGIEHLEKDPDCAAHMRNIRGHKIHAELDKIFPTRTTREWLAALTEIDVLVTEVASYKSILASEQARANGYLLEMEHPTAGNVTVAGSPLTFNSEIQHRSAAPPDLGQHTEEVLLELGYTWEQITRLREAQVIL
ncbi:MAG TPA: CoA transferase [Candidatus Binataceae bacterium]|nr:CoA transferase [Candidatus Binataceae bacterium]